MMNRRHLLRTTACGFGSLAFNAMASSPLADRHGHHFPKAKRVIFLFMAGGVSHVDSFDHKPKLDELDGKMLDFDDARVVAKTGMGAAQRVMKSLWPHQRRGQCGHWASELFPHMGSMVDDLTFIHSMHTEGVAHGPATIFLHTGSTAFVRPSMGAWVTYGLGTENENLPAFVSISPSMGNGGPRNYGTAFLPPVYQGTAMGRSGIPAKDSTIRNVRNELLGRAEQERQFEFISKLNRAQFQRSAAKNGGHDPEVEAVINSYELAWRLQNHAPEAFDIAKESEATKAMYGIGDGLASDNYGRQCLIARRLAEQGVRYIQVNYSDNSNNPAWDQHSNMPKHAEHAAAVDKPVWALVQDLKQRGLLEDTIVWWGGEFGRTPYSQQNGTGRDHNPGGFTVWLAGGGFKSGHSHGQTDEFGHMAVQNKVHMHDLHATILHQLGLDHEKLTFRHAGRDFRLTDVHGHVVHDILA
ncbi:MAG: DUF1501 domain-containing protein [Verrucomicrobiaceae bacterium]|nr:DUF1501 domain-containing protein [Verrucomicrobiaceae bacterium]